MVFYYDMFISQYKHHCHNLHIFLLIGHQQIIDVVCVWSYTLLLIVYFVNKETVVVNLSHSCIQNWSVYMYIICVVMQSVMRIHDALGHKRIISSYLNSALTEINNWTRTSKMRTHDIWSNKYICTVFIDCPTMLLEPSSNIKHINTTKSCLNSSLPGSYFYIYLPR